MITVVVHKFRVGDVEDPDYSIVEPITKWQQSEAGEWVMKNALDMPTWHRITLFEERVYSYEIHAMLTDENYIYWKLKFA